MELSYAPDSAALRGATAGLRPAAPGLAVLSSGVRVALREPQLRVLVRAAREALAGDPLRAREVADVYELHGQPR